MIELFESRDIQVFSAHRREAWGQNLENPKVALVRDLQEMARVDLVIAIIGVPPSPGVQLEIGYALALAKPIIILCEEGQFIPYLNKGLTAATATLVIEYKNEAEIGELLRHNLNL